MNKKMIILGAGLLILLVVGIWLLIPRGKREEPTKSPLVILDTSKWTAPLQPANKWENVTYLSTNKIKYYAGEDYFELDLKALKAVSLTGEKPIFPFVTKTFWSEDGNRAIIKITNDNYVLYKISSPLYDPDIPDGSLATWFYDFATQKAIRLSLDIKELTWTADAQKIVYQYKAKGVNSLNIADPDGKNWKKIIDLKEETIFLNTLGTGEIFYTASETTDSFNVLKTDGSGKRAIKLPIQVNINKMVWSSDGKSLFSAIREANKTTDTFYKINLETGQKEDIKYESKALIDAKNLILAKDGKVLYFTSDDYLYKLGL